MSAHLTQYLCDIHTIELCVKDTFNNTPGMKTILKKTKKLAKFTHKSTVAAKELKREAEKQNIPFRKIANPPKKPVLSSAPAKATNQPPSSMSLCQSKTCL